MCKSNLSLIRSQEGHVRSCRPPRARLLLVAHNDDGGVPRPGDGVALLCHGLTDVREELTYRSDVVSEITPPRLGVPYRVTDTPSSSGTRGHCRPTRFGNSAYTLICSLAQILYPYPCSTVGLWTQNRSLNL